jgi:hypothetical protein
MEFLNTFSQEKIQALEEINTKLLNKNDSPNNNIIFAYCPPKVGSTTLVSSIRLSAARRFTVIHIHDETFFSVISNNKSINEISVNDVILYNKNLGKNVYVVDIFRSPIERKISEFFEQIASLHFNNSEKNINTYNLDKVIYRFNNLFPFLSNSDYYKERYNLSNFPDNFDFDNKYLLQEDNGIKYIKLRLKDSNLWGNILTKILGTPITIINDYETDKKPLGDLFRSFKELYKIPENFLDSIKKCPSLEYYYNDDERAEYLNSWELKKTNIFDSYTCEEYTFYNQLCLENQSQNLVQIEHYIDIGCLCVACSVKRSVLLSKALRGEKINEKIIHSGAVNEIKNIIDNKNRIMAARVNRVNALIQERNARQNKPSASGTRLVKNNMKNIVSK